MTRYYDKNPQPPLYRVQEERAAVCFFLQRVIVASYIRVCRYRDQQPKKDAS